MTSSTGYGSYGGALAYSDRPAGHSAGDFTRLSQAISNNIQKINQNVNEMQRLLAQFNTKQDTSELRDKLHKVQHYTNQLAKDTNKYMKDLSSLPPPTLLSEQKQQKMLKERLTNEFTQSLNSFQSAQRQEKEKERASAPKHSSVTYDPFAEDTFGESKPSRELEKSEQIQISGDVDYELMRQREEELRKLESDIMDVNQIFKDLGMLVHEQGEVIDSIEANVENAAVSVEQGTEQLQRARAYQSKARRRKCIIITIIIVVLLIIVIILCATLINR